MYSVDSVGERLKSWQFHDYFGIRYPMTQHRRVQELIIGQYSEASQTLASTIGNYNRVLIHSSQAKHAFVADTDAALEAWLGDVEVGSDQTRPRLSNCLTPRVNFGSAELSQCAYCGMPSAILRKCSGCGKVTYVE